MCCCGFRTAKNIAFVFNAIGILFFVLALGGSSVGNPDDKDSFRWISQKIILETLGTSVLEVRSSYFATDFRIESSEVNAPGNNLDGVQLFDPETIGYDDDDCDADFCDDCQSAGGALVFFSLVAFFGSLAFFAFMIRNLQDDHLSFKVKVTSASLAGGMIFCGILCLGLAQSCRNEVQDNGRSFADNLANQILTPGQSSTITIRTAFGGSYAYMWLATMCAIITCSTISCTCKKRPYGPPPQNTGGGVILPGMSMRRRQSIIKMILYLQVVPAYAVNAPGISKDEKLQAPGPVALGSGRLSSV